MEPFEPDSKVTLRPMALDDLVQVEALDQVSFPTPWPKDAFRYELTRNPYAICWVAESVADNGAALIVGSIVVWLVVDEAHISTLAVHPDWRRRHIAQCLLGKILQICLGKGAILAMLEVRKSNLAAQSLYEKFGFEPVGVRRGYYQDTHEDAILMTLPDLKQIKLGELACAGMDELSIGIENGGVS